MPGQSRFFKRASFALISALFSDACDVRSVASAKMDIMPGVLKGKDLTHLLLTSYRPNFCCECGEKIVRLRWRLWTSRKFCDNCARTSWKDYWLQRTVIVAGLMLVGLLFGRGCRRERPPLVIERPVASASQTDAPPPTQPPAAVEQASICGARTKKGKPCSRRVHGPVRCWQHKGMPPMLPAEKLLIRE